MWKKIALALVAGLALASAAACVHSAPPPSLRPALSGAWVLRGDGTSATVDTTTSARGAYRGADEGGYAGRGGRRGGERGEGGSGSRGATYNPEVVAVALAAVHRGEARITIVQTDTTIHFDFADASYFDLVPNGHKQDDVWRNVGRITSMARWTDAGLLLQRKTEDGVTVAQTYARPAGSNEMTVTTVISGPVPRPVNEKRVYVPAPAGK